MRVYLWGLDCRVRARDWKYFLPGILLKSTTNVSDTNIITLAIHLRAG